MAITAQIRKKLLEVDDAKNYPKWFRRALARRLLLMLLPDEISRNLPRWLTEPIFGENADYPPDVPWPYWMIIPPDFTWPEAWTPWIMFKFAPGVAWDNAFPPTWQPGAALPPGVTLPPGYTLPSGWTFHDLPPPGIIMPPFVPNYDRKQGPAPPLYIDPWSPGPLLPHKTSPPGTTGELTLTPDFGAELSIAGTVWSTIHDAAAASSSSWPLDAIFTATLIDKDILDIFRICRTVLRFDLSGIPSGSEILSATLNLFFNWGAYASVLVQTAESASGYQVSDYSKITGAAAPAVTIADGWNTWTMSANQLSYMAAKIGTVVVFIFRDNANDVANIAPAGGAIATHFLSQFSDDPEKWPYLYVRYKA